jgi:hypothetical protein
MDYLAMLGKADDAERTETAEPRQHEGFGAHG